MYKNILIIEPFYRGSHQAWADGYINSSKHNINLIHLSGHYWKWRMHGGAITLANIFKNKNYNPDLILATDMLNLPVFKSLVSPRCPIHLYFHENQITYPWSPNDQDIVLNRDKHYGFINYSSALVADHNYFNSQFHFDSFFIGLEKFINLFPDHKNIENIDSIKKKSSVLHLGLNLKAFDKYNFIPEINDLPLILWNHRWEYDKNPEIFFSILEQISKLGIDFNLAIIGQDFKKTPNAFIKSRKTLKKHIIQFGYVNSFEEYSKWLWKSDIIPVTSNQDFFGCSIMEAVYCNTKPILPHRLSYPELFKFNENPQLFYFDDNQLKEKLIEMISNISKTRKYDFRNLAKIFDWSNMSLIYDKNFNNI